MGGYGHNLSNLLKNSRRKERKAYDGWTESDKESQGIKTEPVSEEVLMEIRNKIQQQNQITTIKIIAVIAICIVTITWLLF